MSGSSWSQCRRSSILDPSPQIAAFLQRVPPGSGHHGTASCYALIPDHPLAVDVEIVEAATINRKHARIAGSTRLQRAELRAANGSGRNSGRGLEDRCEVHAEAEEFRHGGDQVMGR